MAIFIKKIQKLPNLENFYSLNTLIFNLDIMFFTKKIDCKPKGKSKKSNAEFEVKRNLSLKEF